MAADQSSRTDLRIIQVPDPAPDGAAGATPVDAWALGRARLVAFKADRLLSAAQRELGAFGVDTLSADLAPDLLEASEHVGQALAVLERLQDRLRDSGR
jgi:hypothetical protein